MCSINTLKYVAEIYMLLMDINIEKLKLFNYHNVNKLKYVSFSEQDGKEEKDDVAEELEESILKKMNNIFQLVINLILSSEGKDNDTAFEEASKCLNQLADSIHEIKGLNKIRMDSNLQQLIDRAIDKLIQRSNKHFDLISNIINCKGLLYKS